MATREEINKLAQIVKPYFFAFLLTALATWILYAVRSFIDPTIVALLFLLPVGVSSAWWGLGPGILSALMAFLSLNYYFLPPYYTFLVHRSQDLLGLLIFLGVAVVISQLLGRYRQSLANATAREHEAIRLFELSQALAPINNQLAIIRALAERVQEDFLTDRVAVFLETSDLSHPLFFEISNRLTASKPDQLLPLQTVQGMRGELRLWRSNLPFSQQEERLLSIYANQAVLTLERARLAEIETRTKVLEESDRLKSSLLSSVSHELRTPLATIKAAAGGLSSQEVEWDSAGREELLAIIEEEADQLDRLVGNLLNMSRIEAGELKPLRKWQHLDEIINGVIQRTQHRTSVQESQQTHKFNIDIPEDLPLVLVDYIQMEQVFTNLFSNSMKYSPLGSTIQVNARPDHHGFVLVQVTNQGPPVPEQDLEHIFDKFHRLTATDRVTGSGLGLSICKGIVEAHGGRIWAKNLPNGFAILFSIPTQNEGALTRIDPNE